MSRPKVFEVMTAAITKADPGARLDGKSEDYVRGRFEGPLGATAFASVHSSGLRSRARGLVPRSTWPRRRVDPSRDRLRGRGRVRPARF